MVDINPINPQSISVNTVPIGSININNTSSNSINSSTNADAQLAYSWAVGTGLIQGIDYSSKTYAQQSKDAKDSLLNNESFVNVSNSLTNIIAVSDDLANIDTLADNINNYHNLLLYEEIE